ncbi:hypothetical protein N0V90_011090 [Kalmusia sp. IMI 367209]|nr:hypothetical protein N0V90_011090 [Kalmusia sp. IMI 367209]
MSLNPFDDVLYRVDSYDSMKESGKTIDFPDTIAVPLINTLPSLLTYQSSSASPISTAPSSPPPLPPPHAPLAWTEADFSYLLSAIYPDQMIADELVLETHSECPYGTFSAFKLELYLRIPQRPVSGASYDAKMPIGTGRPVSKVLVAYSDGATPAAARRALAREILSDTFAFAYITAYYNLLAELYFRPLSALLSVKRGILGMSAISEAEWLSRSNQVRQAGVNEEWDFEVRLEAFLLAGGASDLKRWFGGVEIALGLGKGRG